MSAQAREATQPSPINTPEPNPERTFPSIGWIYMITTTDTTDLSRTDKGILCVPMEFVPTVDVPDIPRGLEEETELMRVFVLVTTYSNPTSGSMLIRSREEYLRIPQTEYEEFGNYRRVRTEIIEDRDMLTLLSRIHADGPEKYEQLMRSLDSLHRRGIISEHQVERMRNLVLRAPGEYTLNQIRGAEEFDEPLPLTTLGDIERSDESCERATADLARIIKSFAVFDPREGFVVSDELITQHGGVVRGIVSDSIRLSENVLYFDDIGEFGLILLSVPEGIGRNFYWFLPLAVSGEYIWGVTLQGSADGNMTEIRCRAFFHASGELLIHATR